MTAARFGFADLVIKNDVAGELKLSEAETKTLDYIATKSGEINWNWEDSTTKQATKEMMADLINKELVRERTRSATLGGRVTIALTDKGRNVVELHRKRKVVAGAVKAIEL